MFRSLNVLLLTLALVALGGFVASCGSSNSSSQIRFVHAIADAGPMDIKVNSTKIFSDVAFMGYQPSAGYIKVPSGSVTVEGLQTGTMAEVFTSNTSLGSGQHTIVATGSVGGTNGGPIKLLTFPDTNTASKNGNAKLRVINAAPSTQNASVDIYFVFPPIDPIRPPPSISGLAYGQASNYIDAANLDYIMYVTPTGSTNPIFSQQLLLQVGSPGAIRTLVLTDVPNGGSLNHSAIELKDLN